MRIKEETKIALVSVLVIYVIFTVVKALFFPEQSFLWHVYTSLAGLVFILFFGYIVRLIDIYLDKVFPFERSIITRILLQFTITLFVVLAIRIITAVLFLDELPIKPTREIIVATFAINIFMVLSVILSIFGYHFFKRWKQEKIVAAELEREKAQVQYDNLKNQLNPHFLFNSLTSLNSLIFENPQLASDFLQQLSKVYRYVLANKEKNLVSVQTEIDFVKHYIQLLKTRFEEGLVVNFNTGEAALQRAIVPVTLQILIENAIKHNSTQKQEPLVVQIYDNDDFLVIENNINPKNIMDSSNGQGLENLRGLYRYLSDREIVVERSGERFVVSIPLLDM